MVFLLPAVSSSLPHPPFPHLFIAWFVSPEQPIAALVKRGHCSPFPPPFDALEQAPSVFNVVEANRFFWETSPQLKHDEQAQSMRALSTKFKALISKPFKSEASRVIPSYDSQLAHQDEQA